MNKPNAVTWFEIYVNDMNRAKKFYENVFQVSLQKLDTPMPNLEMWVFAGDPNSFGASGALCKMEGVKAGNNAVLVYFSSADCAIEEKRIVESGGKIMKPKTSISPFGAIVLAYDTEGNMFGVHSMK